MPRSLPCARRFALALAEALVVGDLHRLLERGVIVAGVVGHDHRRLVREGLDEVLPAQVGRIDAELARADLDQPLDHEGRLRPSGAAIGVDRHGVGVDRVDLAIDRRDVVLARQQRRIEIGRHRRRERRHIGAEIGDGLDPAAPMILPSASNAISAWVTWSRPCASARNASERSRRPISPAGRPSATPRGTRPPRDR